MTRALTIATVILGILSAATLVAMFGALHDISNDYASADTWSRGGQAVPDWVPAWTACELEWTVVEIGWLLLVAFHIMFFVSLVVRYRRGRPLEGLE